VSLEKVFILVLLLATGCTSLPRTPPPSERPAFTFPAATFAFANETVFAYEAGQPVADTRAATRRYSRRCFVMAAAAAQFGKFAAFDPLAPPVSREELARRVRRVVRRPLWSQPAAPIRFPGYASLRDFSDREGALVQANLGPGWTTFFLMRKWCMMLVPSATHQARLNLILQEWLRHGEPMVLWIYNFPRMNVNHAVVAYALTTENGRTQYAVYDPNFTDRPRRLEYDPVAQTFAYEPTFYFPGGPVHVRPAYISHFQ